MSRLRRSFLRMTLILTSLFLCGCGLLYLGQDRLIFFPRQYGPDAKQVQDRYEVLEFDSSQGRQRAFYRGPSGKLPEKIWVMTGGNASLALGWDWLVDPAAKIQSDFGFLLIEYPGYGEAEGQPGRKTIAKTVDGAISALTAHLELPEDKVIDRISFIGHSLGAAVAFETASRLNRGEVIALSPFTSMKDMARRTIGKPLSNLARHRWDNRARVAEVAELPGAQITIFHGDSDTVIPAFMGRELGEIGGEVVEFREVKNAHHNNIVDTIRPELVELLTR
ncbi:MAG: alpha/beta hydrolase [Verrucomicrobiales bacterium]|nr:alpha/beta hydrolase [Verrucomicrobiales bacterium]